jgi:protein TIF31
MGRLQKSQKLSLVCPITVSKLISVPPLTIRVPAPAHGRTLPKRTPAEDYSNFQIYAQNHESIQDLKLTLNEWVGGYWLGPYALRLPRDSSASTEEGGMAKEGQSLSDYLEISEVFGPNDQSRVLEIAKGMSEIWSVG